MTGFFLAAAGFAAATLAQGPVAVVFCLTLSQGALDLAVPVAWATCVEIGGEDAGTATGFMNTASSLSGILSPVTGAWLAVAFGSFHAMFLTASAIYVFGGLM